MKSFNITYIWSSVGTRTLCQKFKFQSWMIPKPWYKETLCSLYRTTTNDFTNKDITSSYTTRVLQFFTRDIQTVFRHLQLLYFEGLSYIIYKVMSMCILSCYGGRPWILKTSLKILVNPSHIMFLCSNECF